MRVIRNSFALVCSFIGGFLPNVSFDNDTIIRLFVEKFYTESGIKLPRSNSLETTLEYLQENIGNIKYQKTLKLSDNTFDIFFTAGSKGYSFFVVRDIFDCGKKTSVSVILCGYKTNAVSSYDYLTYKFHFLSYMSTDYVLWYAPLSEFSLMSIIKDNDNA